MSVVQYEQPAPLPPSKPGDELVARRLGRRSVLIELNPDYARLAARRLQQLSLLT